jgi:uncharacterized protein DUF6916
MPDELTQATFAPHVGSPFRVHVGDSELELTLVEVSDVRVSPRVEAFSLEFRGPAASPLPQAEYQFDHPVIGELALFIVPVGRDGDALEYEAVFNRLHPRP